MSTIAYDIEIAGFHWEEVDEITRAYLLKKARTEEEREAVPDRTADNFKTHEPLYRAWQHLGRWATSARVYAKAAAGNDEGGTKRRLEVVRKERAAVMRWLDIDEKG